MFALEIYLLTARSQSAAKRLIPNSKLKILNLESEIKKAAFFKVAFFICKRRPVFQQKPPAVKLFNLSVNTQHVFSLRTFRTVCNFKFDILTLC